MTLEEFQRHIEAIYFVRDAQRGVDKTFIWLIEEVGELAKEIRKRPPDPRRLREEFADVLAWLTTLASLVGVEMEACAQIYAGGCPKCQRTPCAC